MKWSIVKLIDNGSAHPVDSFTGSLVNAIDYARLYATDHCERIMLDNGSLRDIPSGSEFVTNNGTPVSYIVRPDQPWWSQ